VHTFGVALVVASAAFLGTMYDNYFAFATQLLVTDPKKVRGVVNAQAVGIAVLIIFSMAVGKSLSFLPLRAIGVACIAPWALGWHSWRHRKDSQPAVFKRGALTTFLMTFALGGDNIAVWIPLFRADSVVRMLTSVAVFAFWEMVFVVSAQRVAHHPTVIDWGTKSGKVIIPWVYFLLGVVILLECRTL